MCRIISVTKKDLESCSTALRVGPAGKLNVQSRGAHKMVVFQKAHIH